MVSEENRMSSRPSPSRKLADSVARRIGSDIAGQGWPIGEVLGSEAEFLELYGISRGVFREAVRLLEHKGIAQMRRGPGGGLVVRAPEASGVIVAVGVYLQFSRVSVDEVFEARRVVEGAASELAAVRLTEETIGSLRANLFPERAEREVGVQSPHDLHAVIGSASRSEAMELFVNALVELTSPFLAPTDIQVLGRSVGVRRESEKAHQAIGEAVLAGNGGLARHRMEMHLDAMAEWVRERRVSPTVLAQEIEHFRLDGGVKRAEGVARGILRNIVEGGWKVGTFIGSEDTLMQEHDVSRSTLREAVRILEHHQIVEVKRGRGGGLLVTEPGLDAIVDAVSFYLDQRGIGREELYEVRATLESANVQRAARRLDVRGKARLHEVLRRERERSSTPRDFASVGHDLHLVVAELSENRVLWLFTLVMYRLTVMRATGSDVPRGDEERMPETVNRAHQAIVDAICDGDPEVAKYRMEKHLAAMVPWLR